MDHTSNMKDDFSKDLKQVAQKWELTVKEMLAASMRVALVNDPTRNSRAIYPLRVVMKCEPLKLLFTQEI